MCGAKTTAEDLLKAIIPKPDSQFNRKITNMLHLYYP